jgi:hypothetical protein
VLKGPEKRAFEHFVIEHKNADLGKRLVFRRGQPLSATLKA